jgi:hypothetical protein
MTDPIGGRSKELQDLTNRLKDKKEMSNEKSKVMVNSITKTQEEIYMNGH